MIKRIRYVVVRTKDEAVFCGLARNYQFKTLYELVADIMNMEGEE